MRVNGIIRGDTDAPTTLSDLQHGATIQLAVIAIQDELNEMTSDMLIAYEHDATGIVSAVAGTRSYALASNFIRFFGTPALYNSGDNNYIYEFPGGEQQLQQMYPDYKTAQSNPQYWYFDATTTKKIALWPVPQDNKNYSYDYEKDVSVAAAADTMPFHNEQEAQAFCRMAARRFKMLYEEKDPATLIVDPEHMKAKATLVALMVGKNPAKKYAPIYR
jgi:hypothetical protein